MVEKVFPRYASAPLPIHLADHCFAVGKANRGLSQVDHCSLERVAVDFILPPERKRLQQSGAEKEVWKLSKNLKLIVVHAPIILAHTYVVTNGVQMLAALIQEHYSSRVTRVQTAVIGRG